MLHRPMSKAYPIYGNKLVLAEYKGGIKIIMVLTYITANQGFIKSTWNYIFHMLTAIVIAPFQSQADIGISKSPQFFSELAGYFVSHIKRCSWPLKIREVWTEAIVAVGTVNNRMTIRTLEAIEAFVYSQDRSYRSRHLCASTPHRRAWR